MDNTWRLNVEIIQTEYVNLVKQPALQIITELTIVLQPMTCSVALVQYVELVNTAMPIVQQLKILSVRPAQNVLTLNSLFLDALVSKTLFVVTALRVQLGSFKKQRATPQSLPPVGNVLNVHARNIKFSLVMLRHQLYASP